MGYRLTSGGTSAKYVTIPSCSLAGDFDITLVATQAGQTNGTFLFAGTGVAGQNGLDLYRGTTGKYLVIVNNVGVITGTINASNNLAAPDTIRISRVAGVITLRVNGVVDGTASDSNTLRIDRFFHRNAWAYYGNMAFYTMSITAASGNRYYDASASGGVGTSLPDTIGAQNGTLVGFSVPADWVFYSSGATYTLTAQGATYTYSGASANLTYTTAGTVYTLTALGGSYSYSGASAELAINRRIIAQGASYNYSGASAELSRNYRLTAQGGAYTYSGASAELTYTASPGVYRLTALGANYVYSGGSAELTATGIIPAANPAAFINRAYVGGRLTNNARIGGSLTNNATVAI